MEVVKKWADCGYILKSSRAIGGMDWGWRVKKRSFILDTFTWKCARVIYISLEIRGDVRAKRYKFQCTWSHEIRWDCQRNVYGQRKSPRNTSCGTATFKSRREKVTHQQTEGGWGSRKVKKKIKSVLYPGSKLKKVFKVEEVANCVKSC